MSSYQVWFYYIYTCPEGVSIKKIPKEVGSTPKLAFFNWEENQQSEKSWGARRSSAQPTFSSCNRHATSSTALL